jgi:general stress protein YciG
METSMPDNDTSNRGFASMDEDKQREIASKGGQSVPDEKRSFSQDPELAAEAGRKGGEASGGGNRQGGNSGEQNGGQSTQGRQQGQGGGQGTQSSQQGQRGGSGNFSNDPERASEAGRKGGQA